MFMSPCSEARVGGYCLINSEQNLLQYLTSMNRVCFRSFQNFFVPEISPPTYSNLKPDFTWRRKSSNPLFESFIKVFHGFHSCREWQSIHNRMAARETKA